MGSAVKEQGITYSRFIGAMKKNNIELDRKILAQLAKDTPETFRKIVDRAVEKI